MPITWCGRGGCTVCGRTVIHRPSKRGVCPPGARRLRGLQWRDLSLYILPPLRIMLVLIHSRRSVQQPPSPQ